MQRDFYDLHRHHRRHHHHHQQHHHSAVDSHAQLLYRPEDGHEAFRRAEAVMRPHEAERALRERYLVICSLDFADNKFIKLVF